MNYLVFVQSFKLVKKPNFFPDLILLKQGRAELVYQPKEVVLMLATAM